MISCNRRVEMDSAAGRLKQICLFKLRVNVLNTGRGKLSRKPSQRTYLQGVCCIERHRRNIMFMCSLTEKHTQRCKKRFSVFYLKPICDAQWHLFYSVSSAGRKVKCGRLFHLREGRHIHTRWILHQSHKWVPALNMKAGSLSKMTYPALLFSLNPHLQVAIQFSGSLQVFFLTKACGVFFSWLPTMRSLFTSNRRFPRRR